MLDAAETVGAGARRREAIRCSTYFALLVDKSLIVADEGALPNAGDSPSVRT